MHFRKGSREAKAYMAKLRELRGKRNPLSKTERAFAAGHVAAHKEDIRRFGKKRLRNPMEMLILGNPDRDGWYLEVENERARFGPFKSLKDAEGTLDGLRTKPTWKKKHFRIVRREGGKIYKTIRYPSNPARSPYAVCTAAGVRQHTAKMRRCVRKVMRRNPAPGPCPAGCPPQLWADPEFRRELAVYRKRHGNGPIELRRVTVPDGFPKYLSVYGRVPELKYDAPKHSTKGRRIHHFGKRGKKATMPFAVTSASRGPKFLALVSGTFKAKPDWIFD